MRTDLVTLNDEEMMPEEAEMPEEEMMSEDKMPEKRMSEMMTLAVLR